MKVVESKLIANIRADFTFVQVEVVSIEAFYNFSHLGSPRGFGGFEVGVCVRHHVNRKFVYPHFTELQRETIRRNRT